MSSKHNVKSSGDTRKQKQVVLFDTTLRDGTQGEGVSFSAEDKLEICKRLDQFGMDYIEGGWPGSNPKDVEFFEKAKNLRLKHAKLTAFGSTRRASLTAEEDPNLRAIVESGAVAAAIFGKSWDFHVKDVLRTTLEENLKMIEESVAFLKFQGIEVIYDAEHFFDGYKANPEYALATIAAAARGGASYVVLCDTNGGSLPSFIQEGVRAAKEAIDTKLGIHTHNDSGLAVANALAAIEEGVVHVQGTVNGFGERSGNCDLIQVIPNVQLKMGLHCIDEGSMKKLTGLSRYVSEMANVQPNPSHPFVGKSVFAHKGGTHVAALVRNPETYEHMAPETVGNERRVLISELSGAGNIIYKAKEMGVELSRESPALRRIVDTIKEMEHEGYHFEGAEASFELILKKELGMYQSYFDLLGLKLTIDKRDPDDEGLAEATIKVRIGDEVYHTAADGNGPVNALDNALRKALESVYPAVSRIHLVDYKVRVLNEAAGTEAPVRVLVTSTENGQSFGTVGVSTNIIQASWRAVVDSIEYGLMRVDEIPRTTKEERIG